MKRCPAIVIIIAVLGLMLTGCEQAPKPEEIKEEAVTPVAVTQVETVAPSSISFITENPDIEVEEPQDMMGIFREITNDDLVGPYLSIFFPRKKVKVDSPPPSEGFYSITRLMANQQTPESDWKELNELLFQLDTSKSIDKSYSYQNLPQGPFMIDTLQYGVKINIKTTDDKAFDKVAYANFDSFIGNAFLSATVTLDTEKLVEEIGVQISTGVKGMKFAVNAKLAASSGSTENPEGGRIPADIVGSYAISTSFGFGFDYESGAGIIVLEMSSSNFRNDITAESGNAPLDLAGTTSIKITVLSSDGDDIIFTKSYASIEEFMEDFTFDATPVVEPK